MRTLYRPVGFKELCLILDTGCRRYPERLPTQPVFYPVLNQEYAIEIARKWNTKDSNSDFSGYVTEFDIDEDYVSQYEPHIVGAAWHEELWVPAEELSIFCKHIVPPIKISHAFYGEQYIGKDNQLDCNNYIEQLILLKQMKNDNPVDFSSVIQSNWKIVTLNYIAWFNHDYADDMDAADKKVLLAEIKEILIRNKKWFFVF